MLRIPTYFPTEFFFSRLLDLHSGHAILVPRRIIGFETSGVGRAEELEEFVAAFRRSSPRPWILAVLDLHAGR